MRLIICIFLSFLALQAPANSDGNTIKPILVGLDADMSSGSAPSGKAIKRGIILAINAINEKGGVLGRPLKLVVRDHRGNPARGQDNLEDFSSMDDLAAVFSGIHTPVVLKELEAIHANKLLFLVPWAAGTPIIDNDYDPNFVFRVSVRDQYAGDFLVNHALSQNHRRLGLLFEQTGWGRSNERATAEALAKHNLSYTGIEWFSWGVSDLTPQIERLRNSGAEAILLVANPREGGTAVKSMLALSEAERLPIISHWGISGGNFFKDNEDALKRIQFEFLQTFSFFSPPDKEQADLLWQAYRKNFPDVKNYSDAMATVGTAHAYDLARMLALAIEMAGTIDRTKIREKMEKIPSFQGVMKFYNPPFTPLRHDALDAGSFIMARFSKTGSIIPVEHHD